MKLVAGLLLFGACGSAQEASSGFDLRATITGQGVYSRELTQPPRSGNPLLAGARVLLYPTWKLNEHWTFTASLQAYTHPFFETAVSDARHGREDRRSASQPELFALLESRLGQRPRRPAFYHLRVIPGTL